MLRVRIGTCSWADESLLKLWYPREVRSAEARLRYYAEHFDTVEVDSTYYRLPEVEMTTRWAERTPPGFVFHVKAFGVMTRHPVRVQQLPPDLRDEAEVDDRGRVYRPSREFRAKLFSRFGEALEPLRAAGKLGGVLLQFPPYVVPRESSTEYIKWARKQLDNDEVLVEFRHRSWLDGEQRAQTLSFLEDIGANFVITDSPRTEATNVVPTVQAVTGDTAYVRFHGRNAATWNVRGKSAAQRFDYLYSEGELGEWTEPFRELTGRAGAVYAFFNNNGRSQDATGGWVAQAPTNAMMLRRTLTDANVPVS